jgi:hypothetical protein
MAWLGPGTCASAQGDLKPSEIAGHASPPQAWSPQLSEDSRDEGASHFDAPNDWPWIGNRENASASLQWPSPARLKLPALPQAHSSMANSAISKQGPFENSAGSRKQLPESSGPAGPSSRFKRPRLRNRSTAVSCPRICVESAAPNKRRL